LILELQPICASELITFPTSSCWIRDTPHLKITSCRLRLQRLLSLLWLPCSVQSCGAWRSQTGSIFTAQGWFCFRWFSRTLDRTTTSSLSTGGSSGPSPLGLSLVVRKLESMNYDLAKWRSVVEKSNSKDFREGFQLLDLDDQAGWEFVKKVMAFEPGQRPSAAQALRQR